MTNNPEEALVDLNLALVVQESRAPEKTKSDKKKTNPAAVYLASLHEGKGRLGVMGQLKFVAEACGFGGDDWLARMPWPLLRSSHLKALLIKRGEHGESPATINLMRAAVRGVAREAFDAEQLEGDELQRILNVKTVRGSRLLAGRDLKNGELTDIIGACDNGTVGGVRDAAILALLFGAGMRRDSVAKLTLSSLDMQEARVRFIGKGNKEHTVPLPRGTVAALTDWLDLRGHAPGPVFHPVLKNGKIRHEKGISSQTVYDVVKLRALRANLKTECSPHDFRRTFITTVLEKTGDLAVAQDLAGHADPKTTKQYDRRGEKAKRAAVDLLYVPYAPKNQPPAQLDLSELAEEPIDNKNGEEG